ncbi:Protoporphyrinogen oxidase [Meredithblackwellia eburnea MCA 4105]
MSIHLRWSSSNSKSGSQLDTPYTLAVVGGGISGLSSVYYFLKALSPAEKLKAKVVILEKEQRVGGWCRSVKVPVQGVADDKSIVFETGPRSIRPSGLQGWLTIQLAQDLNLTDSIITVSKTAPSARNRYIYNAKSQPGVTLIPTNFFGIMTSPFIRSLIPGVLGEFFRSRRATAVEDESVDNFVRRRFGPKLAEDVVSAVIHGIYSGDTRRLSAKAVFPGLWELERESGSVLRGAMFGKLLKQQDPNSPFRRRAAWEGREMDKIKLNVRNSDSGGDLVKRMEGASVWGVKGGIGELTEALRERLISEGVEFQFGSNIRGGDLSSGGKGLWKVQNSPSTSLLAQHVITPPSILPQESSHQGEEPLNLRPPRVPHATVSVITLLYPPTSTPLFPSGFGYLIPRSCPLSHNPHHALGVIFDSDVMPGVDDHASLSPKQPSPFTTTSAKITLILGGSYWLTDPPSPPNHHELVQWTKETLKIQFPRTHFPEPLAALSNTHVECIPQVPVGHGRIFRELHERLSRDENAGLYVLGEGLAPVGVNGAVMKAWEVGNGVADNVMGSKRRCTGAEGW